MHVRVGALDLSCWTTAAQIARDLLAYAGQVVARADGAYLPFDLIVRQAAAPRAVICARAGGGDRGGVVTGFAVTWKVACNALISSIIVLLGPA